MLLETNRKVALEYMEGGNLYQVLSLMEQTGQLFKEPHIAYIMFETLKVGKNN